MKKIGIFLLYIITIVVGMIFGMIFPNMINSADFGGFEKIKNFENFGKIYKDFSYGNEKLHNFDLYVPLEKTEKSNKLVVYLHAGGFTAGDKSDDENILKNFVKKGYVAAGINYSLRNAENQNASILQMTNDIKNAMPKVLEEAEKLGYKIDEMAIGGGSAGGNLAMTFAYRDAKNLDIPVKFVFNFVGPASFEPSAWYGFDPKFENDEQAKSAGALVSVFVGEEITVEMMKNGEYQDKLKAISPYALVDEKSPPTLTAYGKLDRVAPYSASENYLIPALEKYNIPHDNIVFEKSGHALNRDNDKAKILAEKLDEYFEKYLK